MNASSYLGSSVSGLLGIPQVSLLGVRNFFPFFLFSPRVPLIWSWALNVSQAGLVIVTSFKSIILNHIIFFFPGIVFYCLMILHKTKNVQTSSKLKFNWNSQQKIYVYISHNIYFPLLYGFFWQFSFIRWKSPNPTSCFSQIPKIKNKNK